MSRCKYLALVILIGLSTGLFGQQAENEPAENPVQRQQKVLAAQMLINQMIQSAWNTDMHEELALLPDQVDQLKDIAKQYQKLMAENALNLQQDSGQIQELVKQGDHAKAMVLAKEMQEKMLERMERISEQAKEILLPHQMDRLTQIAKQQTIKHTTPFRDEFGIAFGLAKEIGLNDEETEKLKATIEEVRKEYYADLKKLKEKANKRILAAIPLDKRDKLEALTGKFYDQEQGRRRTMEKALQRKSSPQKTETKSDADKSRTDRIP